MQVAAGGDLYLGGRFVPGAPAIGPLLDGDLRFANLEGPVVAGAHESGLDGEGRPDGQPVRLAVDPARLDAVAGQLDVVSIENNHAFDQGPAGRVETVSHLERRHIAAVTSAAPVELRAGGQRITLLARAYPPEATLEGDERSEVVEAVKRARRRGPVLVSIHFGHTGSLLPAPEQRALAHAVVDAGASAVLGHGPHSPQGVELRGASIIAYSLGNLAFGCRCTDERDAFILRFTLRPDGSVVDASALPIEAGLGRSPLLSADPGLADLLEDLSRDLGTRVTRGVARGEPEILRFTAP